MAKKETKEYKGTVGSWAFVAGIVLAIIIALFGVINIAFVWLLVTVGIIIGLLNITELEVKPFLFSGTVLIIAAAFGQQVFDISRILSRALDATLMVFVPATIVVALKNVFAFASRR